MIKQAEKSLTLLPRSFLVSAGAVGLIVPGVDSSGYPVQEIELQRRIKSSRLLLGRLFDNSSVFSFPGRVDQIGVSGRVWFVCVASDCSSGQWRQLQSGVSQLVKVWRLDRVFIVGPIGIVSIM